jgi:hypothetical protein
MSAASAADSHTAFTMAWNRRSLWAEYVIDPALPRMTASRHLNVSLREA